MSHANGRVYKDGVVVAHFEYDGTVDYCISVLCATHEEVWITWRKKKPHVCTCGRPCSDVTLYTDYGDGSYWPGKVCFPCRAIVEGFKPIYFEPGCGDGEPPPPEGWTRCLA